MSKICISSCGDKDKTCMNNCAFFMLNPQDYTQFLLWHSYCMFSLSIAKPAVRNANLGHFKFVLPLGMILHHK